MGEIAGVISDILHLKNGSPKIGLTWTPREGNAVAHQIALLGSRDGLPVGWIRNPPESLMSLLNKDLDYMRYDRRLDANLNQVDFSNMEYQSDPACSVGCNDHAMIMLTGFSL